MLLFLLITKIFFCVTKNPNCMKKKSLYKKKEVFGIVKFRVFYNCNTFKRQTFSKKKTIKLSSVRVFLENLLMMFVNSKSRSNILELIFHD